MFNLHLSLFGVSTEHFLRAPNNHLNSSEIRIQAKIQNPHHKRVWNPSHCNCKSFSMHWNSDYAENKPMASGNVVWIYEIYCNASWEYPIDSEKVQSVTIQSRISSFSYCKWSVSIIYVYFFLFYYTIKWHLKMKKQKQNKGLIKMGTKIKTKNRKKTVSRNFETLYSCEILTLIGFPQKRG